MNALVEMNGPGIDPSLDGAGFPIAGAVEVDKAVFPAAAATGSLIGTIRDPFVSGSTFVTIGTVPPQLALTGSTITKGAGAAVARTLYRICVQATASDGARVSRSVIEFLAR